MAECYGSADDRFQVKLDQVVIELIAASCIDAKKLETGGILIGKYDEELRLATIVEATPPPKGSRQGKTKFLRGTLGLKKLLDRHWENGLYYLGEWHFHPYGEALPSPQDISQMRQLAGDQRYHCPEPILIIAAGCPEQEFDLGVFIVPHSGDFVPLGLL
tara:strand:+ start:25483 stop:25962 length:480 start_codon:yes stop_codon:yes gene_type:complete